MKKFTLMLIASLLIAGCAPWTRLESKVYKDAKRDFEAELPKDWMRYNLANYFVMTKDGFILDYISVHKLPMKYDLQFTDKQFRDDMLPQEVAEIEIDNFTSNTNIFEFTVTSNVPVNLSGQEAYRFEYAYETKAKLNIKGIMCGFIYDEKVYRINFEAAEQHYYDKYIDDFEKFITTFRLTG